MSICICKGFIQVKKTVIYTFQVCLNYTSSYDYSFVEKTSFQKVLLMKIVFLEVEARMV